jgi:hypothetical protein
MIALFVQLRTGNTYIVLVDVAGRELGNGIGIHKNFYLFASLIVVWASDGLNGNSILGILVSSVDTKMAKAAFKFVQVLEVLHDEDGNEMRVVVKEEDEIEQ